VIGIVIRPSASFRSGDSICLAVRRKQNVFSNYSSTSSGKAIGAIFGEFQINALEICADEKIGTDDS